LEGFAETTNLYNASGFQGWGGEVSTILSAVETDDLAAAIEHLDAVQDSKEVQALMKKAGAPELIGSEREFPGLQHLLTVMVMAKTDDDESLRMLFGSPLRVNGLLLETRCDMRPVDSVGTPGPKKSPSFIRRPSQKMSSLDEKVDIEKICANIGEDFSTIICAEATYRSNAGGLQGGEGGIILSAVETDNLAAAIEHLDAVQDSKEVQALMKSVGAPDLLGSEHEFPGLQPLLMTLAKANSADDVSLRLLFGSPLHVNGLLLDIRSNMQEASEQARALSSRALSEDRRSGQWIIAVNECERVQREVDTADLVVGSPVDVVRTGQTASHTNTGWKKISCAVIDSEKRKVLGFKKV